MAAETQTTHASGASTRSCRHRPLLVIGVAAAALAAIRRRRLAAATRAFHDRHGPPPTGRGA